MAGSWKFEISRSVPETVVIGMLAWALLPVNPYGYYMLLKLVVFCISGWLALWCKERNLKRWVTCFVIIVIIYNPIFRIPFERITWMPINIATIIIFWKFACKSQGLWGR